MGQRQQTIADPGSRWAEIWLETEPDQLRDPEETDASDPDEADSDEEDRPGGGDEEALG